MWYVSYRDGRTLQQFPPSGGELHMGDADICNAGEIEEFWIVPRTQVGKVPAFGFVRNRGFFKREHPFAEPEPLDFPYPVGLPFHWHYHRRIYKILGVSSLGQSELPVRVVQCLGWRLDTETVGREVTFEIGIDNDGSFQIWKKTPLDDPMFEGPQQIIAENGVRIIDMAGV